MYAVLSGDLVKSGRLSTDQLAMAMARLDASAIVAADWHGADLRYSRNRGDGWQVVLANPQLALRTALYFRAALRGEGKEFTTRIAIATGSGLLPAQSDLNAITGPAFVTSGHALDTMQPSVTLMHCDLGATGAVARLLDHISQGWTVAQARAIEPMFAPTKVTHTSVAQMLGKSRQAVDQALDGAGFAAILNALTLLEDSEKWQ